MVNIVEIDGLTKYYDNREALSNISLKIKEGEIVGLLGPNGSGKTSLLKILGGLLKKTRGEIFLGGEKLDYKTKSLVAFLPGENFLYRWMKVRDGLNFFQDFFPDFKRNRAEELLNLFNFDENMEVDSLSRGMVAKLNLILVLSRDAKIHILDEPLKSIDILSRDKILDIIVKEFKEDKTLLISTHLIGDMEKVFDRVIFLDSGKLVLDRYVKELKKEKAKDILGIYRDIFKEKEV